MFSRGLLVIPGRSKEVSLRESAKCRNNQLVVIIILNSLKLDLI